MVEFSGNVARVSEDLIITGNQFQIVGAATEKACLLIMSFVSGTNSCLETDDDNHYLNKHLPTMMNRAHFDRHADPSIRPPS